MYHQYSSPPAWTYYESKSPRTPRYSYTPQYTTSPQATRPSPKHKRAASYTPRKEEYFARYSSSPEYHDGFADYASPHAQTDYVSPNGGMKGTRRFSMSTGGTKHGRERTQEQYIYVGVADYANTSHGYKIRTEPRPRSKKPSTDQWFYYSPQVPNYVDDEPLPKRSRPRRASTTTKTPPKTKSSPPKYHPKATEADAIREGIPAGYSIKNWDPDESPILLLGSVFDANSLGKWIYDWTVFHHGASTPMADVAGDLWLMLIKLAGKMKRAEECYTRIIEKEDRLMVQDFLDSGDKLWIKFKKLLKACESYMWKAAKKEGKGTTMGKNAGCEFVESIFGRDRELENTERLMNSMRLWNMRFDANIEEILRHPSG